MTIGGRRPAGQRGAAAAGYLADLVCGPQRTGEVVAVRTGAALVALDSRVEVPSRMVAIADSTVGATLTANTVLLAGGARPALGASVRIGGGVLLLADRTHRILRYWRSDVRVSSVDPAALGALTRTDGPGPTAAVLHPLAIALVTGAGLAPAARSLVGRGPGSTPAGDDVLAGVALGLRLTDRQAPLADLRAAIDPDLSDRTTALSADLLRAALAGHASPEVLALARTLRPDADPADRGPAVDAVLRLGHTSGADLLAGLVLALRAVLPLAPGPHPRTPAQSRRMAAR